MQRWKLKIEYHGARYCGWQKQEAHVPSVQGIIERAIFNLSGEKVEIFAAGRTDAGVHARGQIAHFNLEKSISGHQILLGLNDHLKGESISILDAQIVPDDFHARFSALRRHYVYQIMNRRGRLVLEQGLYWHVPRPLNVDEMQEAGNYLLGTHDFTSFRAIECQAKSPVRTIDSLKFVKQGDEIRLFISAQSFLHHQVRNIIGSLAQVGLGRWPKERIQEILAHKDRRIAGPTAPAEGLFFLSVDYPD